jgi:hypothetical protein
MGCALDAALDRVRTHVGWEKGGDEKARPDEGRAARLILKLASPPRRSGARGRAGVLLRRLSLSHANKPRKRYEGYANAKKDAGVDH